MRKLRGQMGREGKREVEKAGESELGRAPGHFPNRRWQGAGPGKANCFPLGQATFSPPSHPLPARFY